MRIVLEFEGNDTKALQDFEGALCEKDDNFYLIDSIIWELDYGEGKSVHRTPFGDITIRKQM